MMYKNDTKLSLFTILFSLTCMLSPDLQPQEVGDGLGNFYYFTAVLVLVVQRVVIVIH